MRLRYHSDETKDEMNTTLTNKIKTYANLWHFISLAGHVEIVG